MGKPGASKMQILQYASYLNLVSIEDFETIQKCNIVLNSV